MEKSRRNDHVSRPTILVRLGCRILLLARFSSGANKREI
jgi:hypothetical protein